LFTRAPYDAGMTDPAHSNTDLTDLLNLARETALTAGALAKRRRAEGVEIAASKSSPEDVVTQADRETERLIRRLLAEARPNDGFYGEESEASGGTSGLTWVVDPIDGTVNYLYGIPLYAVSIAVVEGSADPATWRALAGVVYNPALEELYTAAAGRGAFLGSRRLQTNTNVPLHLALAGTGFGYQAERRQWQADIVRGLIGDVRDIRRLGSAALDLCSVAAGRLDVYFERGLNPWDHAAGALIAREAGARVGGLGDDREGESLVIAADPGLYARFEPVLAKLFERHAACAV
jgi:myo-inositol-1(or 4)-monophosphatase